MMAKSTRAAGESYTLEELADPNLPIRIQRAVLGEVDNPSVGTSSSGSFKKGSESSSNEMQSPPGLAPTTESLSEESQTTVVDFTALSMGGSGQTTEQESTEYVAPYNEWSKHDLKQECHNRGLAVSGTVPELIYRLEEDDASQENT